MRGNFYLPRQHLAIFVAIYCKGITKFVFYQHKLRSGKKEDIQNFFKYTMKQCPNMAFDLFIKFVKVYENKIEIGINYAINQMANNEQLIQKVFTETYSTERHFKGNTIKAITRTYDIYVVI